MNRLWKTLEEENISRILEIINKLEKNATKDNPIRIAGHGDADGITATVLTTLALKTKFIEVDIKPQFRDYTDEHIVLDLGAPKTNNVPGIIIDHHDHPLWQNNYNLIWDKVPTTRIIYELFKDRIPDQDKWKVVVGITGDGQPELIPDDIWDMYSSLLLTELDTIEGQYYGKYTHWKAPLYLLLHTPINNIAKTGNTYEAYVLLKKAKNPLDIIYHPMAISADKKIKSILKQISSPKEPGDKLKLLHFRRLPIVFCTISFDEAVARDIAYRIKNIHKNKTVIVVNSKTRSGSIRGDLAKYIANKLVEHGFDAGGHPGYCGVTLQDDKEVSKLLMTLAGICS